MSFGPQGTPSLAPSVALVAPDTSKQHRAVIFDASSAFDPAGKPLRWFWRFDAGTKTKFVEGGPIVEHVFGNAGDDVVEVSVRNDDGAETIVTHPLHITAAGKYSCSVILEGAGNRTAVAAALLALALAVSRTVARRRREPSSSSPCRQSEPERG